MSLAEAANLTLGPGVVEPKIDDANQTNEDKDASDDGEIGDDQKPVGAEAEEALFAALEKNVEKEDAELPHEQPNDVKLAPKLLQSALEQGQVEPEDSAGEDEKKAAESPSSPEPHHPHARVRVDCQPKSFSNLFVVAMRTNIFFLGDAGKPT